MKRIRTVIERHGQKYVDEPVYELISKALKLALVVNTIAWPMDLSDSEKTDLLLRRSPPAKGEIESLLDAFLARFKPSGAPFIAPFIQELSHYERTQLNWVRPNV